MPASPRRCGCRSVLRRVLLCGTLLCAAAPALAQTEPPSLRTFGYFQNALEYVWDYEQDTREKTFLVQQLNLFFQKDLDRRWTALVDIEAVNNFSSLRRWGSLSLSEAWVRYRASRRFNVKAGLHVPPFNNLNEIKNRAPLLPYIIRPYVYETSLNEAIETSAFLPERAYAQVYGFFPLGAAKLDYGVYLGDSPNVNADRTRGQTGADTTDTFLVGARVGVRYDELKAGLSATRDVFVLASLLPGEPAVPRPMLVEGQVDVPRYRLGGDLSYTLGRLYLESEFIWIEHADEPTGVDSDLFFAYATLGFYVTDRLFAYGSYWLERESLRYPDLRLRVRVNIPTGGVSYVVNDMITLKAQYAYVDIDLGGHGHSVFPARFSHLSTAVSVVF